MVRSTIRLACVLALAGAAACSDGSNGPSCTPFVLEPTVITFPIFAPGSVQPFANARVRQDFVEFREVGCPGPQASTYLRFEPLGSYFVTFTYRLDYASDVTAWSFTGSAGLNGLLAPTNDVLISTDPDPIQYGSAQLVFLTFTPL